MKTQFLVTSCFLLQVYRQPAPTFQNYQVFHTQPGPQGQAPMPQQPYGDPRYNYQPMAVTAAALNPQQFYPGAGQYHQAPSIPIYTTQVTGLPLGPPTQMQPPMMQPQHQGQIPVTGQVLPGHLRPLPATAPAPQTQPGAPIASMPQMLGQGPFVYQPVVNAAAARPQPQPPQPRKSHAIQIIDPHTNSVVDPTAKPAEKSPAVAPTLTKPEEVSQEVVLLLLTLPVSLNQR